jgi:hypothetical protein
VRGREREKETKYAAAVFAVKLSRFLVSNCEMFAVAIAKCDYHFENSLESFPIAHERAFTIFTWHA